MQWDIVGDSAAHDQTGFDYNMLGFDYFGAA